MNLFTVPRARARARQKNHREGWLRRRPEIVLVFYTADDEIAAVKSDLIKAVHTALDASPRNQLYTEQRQRGARGDGSDSTSPPS